MLILSPFDGCVKWGIEKSTDLHNNQTSVRVMIWTKQTGSTIYPSDTLPFSVVIKCAPVSSGEWVRSIRNANFWAPPKIYRIKYLGVGPAICFKVFQVTPVSIKSLRTTAWRTPGSGAWWAAVYGVTQSWTRLAAAAAGAYYTTAQ